MKGRDDDHDDRDSDYNDDNYKVRLSLCAL